MKGALTALVAVGLMATAQSCVSMLTGNTGREQAKIEATSTEITAAEKADNDAAWEAKQAEIATQQKAKAEEDKRSQRLAACTEMDQGGWPERLGDIDYLTISRDAVDAMCPWHNDRLANMEAQRAVANSNLSEAEKEAAVRKLWREADAAWANP